MTPTTSQKETRKKNKGGRPRKDGKGTRGSTSMQWKVISQPASTNHYEISSLGHVRRRLKSGEYYNLKAWTTGGPYAAVYLSGIKGATRNRKKVYIHRLVADHFLKQSKKPNKVVHHEVGPHSNTARTLKWVTPSENNKARKFFYDDGTRKSKKAMKSGKVKINAPAEQSDLKNTPVANKTGGKKVAKEKLPENPITVKRAIKILYTKHPPFKKAYKEFISKNKSVTQKNFAEKFREATGKALKIGSTPAMWHKMLLSAMAEIERRLEV